jgi:type VI secretion system secreted protein VgrG
MGAMKIESLASIELKVGGSTIKMDPMSITIQAMNTTVKANLNLETSAGLMATHKAGAIMTIQGSLVKIN